MTGRQAFPVLVGLWAASAAAQSTSATYTATVSVRLDGGYGFTSGYFVTGGTGTQYEMANAGQDIEVFDTGGNFIDSQPGVFAAFAVFDNYTVGVSPATLVFAADVGPACSVTLCVDAFLWTERRGFVPQTSALTDAGLPPTAMTVDTATVSTIRVYFTIPNPSNTTLYEQDFAVNGSGTGLTPMGTALSKTMNTGEVIGLTSDGNPDGNLYISDEQANLYFVPKNYVSNAGATLTKYSQPLPGPGGYNLPLLGIFFYPFPPSPYLLGGGGSTGVYALTPDAGPNTNIVIGNVYVLATSGRPVEVWSAAVNTSATLVQPAASLMLVTESAVATPDSGPDPWLHILFGDYFPGGGPPPQPDAGPDAGVDAGGGGSDAGVPVTPIGPPAGQLPDNANSCNCSTAGSAPVLLVLLLPLLLPRRRR